MSSAVIQALHSTICDDAFAASFQTIGQYRKALANMCMTALDTARTPDTTPYAEHALNEVATTGQC